MEISELKKNSQKNKLDPIYLVLGQEDQLIEQTRMLFLDLLTETEQSMNFATYDMTTDPLSVALDDATSVPFFGDRRLVFITRPYFLTSENIKTTLDQNIQGLQTYLEHPQTSTILVIFAKVDKLDGRKKISKAVQKYATVIDAAKLNGQAMNQRVDQLVAQKGYQLTDDSKNLLIQRSDGDFSAIVANLEKLFLAAEADPERMITKAMVTDLVSPTLESNIFDLVDYVLHKDVQKAIVLYQDLLLNKEEPIKINSILLMQFRLLLQVKILSKKGMTQGDLTKILKVHPYRIKLALQTVRQFSQANLSQAFLGLQANDYQMKSGSADKVLLFELFLLKFAKKEKKITM